MLGQKKDKNVNYMGSKGNHSLLGMGHKKHPIFQSSSHSNVKEADISKHESMDEHHATGLNVKKNKTKTSGLERN